MVKETLIDRSDSAVSGPALSIRRRRLRILRAIANKAVLVAIVKWVAGEIQGVLKGVFKTNWIL